MVLAKTNANILQMNYSSLSAVPCAGRITHFIFNMFVVIMIRTNTKLMPLDFVFLKYDVMHHFPFSFSVHTMEDRFSLPVVSSISLATPILTEQSTKFSEIEYNS